MNSTTFAYWQPAYAEHGIATFPVRVDEGGKRPAVKGYLKIGTSLSEQLALKFANADAFGFAVKRSRIAIVDVDTSDENVLADALEKHGKTPVIVRSGSGHFQAWYRHNGEGRHIRPDAGVPVDILGEGFVVAPPSRGSRWPYEFIQGGLDDVASLPVMRQAPSIAPQRPTGTPLRARAEQTVDVGRRNDTLWRACMVAARACSTHDELLQFAISRNREFEIPLSISEVVKVVASAQSYQDKGMNLVSDRFRAPMIALRREELNELSSDAFVLLAILRSDFIGADEFKVPNSMRERMPDGGWALRRFKAARQLLERSSKICVVRPASSNRGPTLYGWPDTSISR